jgi:hypothetical protein
MVGKSLGSKSQELAELKAMVQFSSLDSESGMSAEAVCMSLTASTQCSHAAEMLRLHRVCVWNPGHFKVKKGRKLFVGSTAGLRQVSARKDFLQ